MPGRLIDTTCKICCQMYTLAGEEEENLPHLLHCGHVYCAACLNTLLVSPSDKITCPDCKMTTCVNDGVDGLQVDCNTIGLVYTANIRRVREERQNPITGKNASESPVKDDGVTLKRALNNAIDEACRKHSELQSVYEALVSGLQSQMSEEKSRLLCEISEMTKKAVELIHKRKVTLITELSMLGEHFSESRAMMHKVEEQKKTLESAIAKANNLTHPFLQEKIENVLEALLAPVDMQAFDLSCLKKHSGLSCCLDEEKLDQCLSITQGNSINAQEERAVRLKKSSKSVQNVQTNTSRPNTGSLFTPSGVQEDHGAFLNNLPSSGPNVLIEEIMEDISVGLSSSPVQHYPLPKHKDGKSNCPPKKEEPPKCKDKGVSMHLFWVVVTHVVDPSHFYVRKVSEERTADQLHQSISNFCFANKGLISPEQTITKGDLLFSSNAAGGWHRVQVTEVCQGGASVAVRQCKAADVTKLKVFFLDHGIEKTTLSGGKFPLFDCLRKPDHALLSEMGQWPPQAIRCSLDGIVPVHVSGWSVESCEEIKLATGSSAVRMQVFREDKKTLLVDLKRSPTDHTNSRMPLSLRDHLVYLEHALFYGTMSASASSCKPLQYYPPVSPKPKTEFYAIVSHINTPAEFFIQLTENMEFPLLTAKLQTFYKEHSEDVSLQVTRPMLEQACVAPYNKDVWYRARITGFHGTRMAEVHFVDLGSVQLIPVEDLRVIKEEFLSLPPMAIWCRLADINSNGGNWCDASIKLFKDLADQKLVTVVMKKSTSMYGPHPVCLFLEDDQTQSKSVAHALIIGGLAKSVEKGSPVSPAVSWDPPLQVEVECSPPASGDGDNVQLTPSISIPASQKDIKVRVCHVKSPASIFVQLLQYDCQLKSIQEQLQQEFATTLPVTVDWQVGMFCAVLVQGLWERGKISSIISSDVTEVMCCDYGISIPVTLDNLRPLPPQLIGSLVLECSLIGIRPAGGSKWTATSCDKLYFQLAGITALMTLKEPPPASPVGVSLLCPDRAGQTVSMADYLISEGLALPDRQYRCAFKREASVQEPFEPKPIKALPALDANREGSQDLSEENEEDEEEDRVPPGTLALPLHPCSSIVEVAPSTKDYPPPQLPEHLGMICLTVTAIGEDGVIYSMTSQAETELECMNRRLQHHIKAPPVLSHHKWHHVQGCIIKGTDMLWHRGRVVEFTGGQVKVQYVDEGITENIPVCHVYPMVVCEDVAQLCVPLRLSRGKPLGKDWHFDAVALMKATMVGRRVNVEIMGLPAEPRDCVAVEIYLDGMPVSRILAHHHPTCINLSAMGFEDQDCSELVDLDDWSLNTKGLDTPQLLQVYAEPTLPKPGKCFPVKIKHLCTPSQIYLSFNLEKGADVCLEELLEWANTDKESLSHLTDFPIGGPCLAEYSDDRFYRAELIGFVALGGEIRMLVRHVDFGSDDTVPMHKLRCLPELLLDIPRQAVCMRLAGFQPPRVCKETKRLSYAPEWSVKALLEMMSLLQNKGVYRAIISTADEETVAYLHSPDGKLVHQSLVRRGLADYEGTDMVRNSHK